MTRIFWISFCLLVISGCRGEGELERMLERRTNEHITSIRSLSQSVAELEAQMQNFDPAFFAQYAERDSIYRLGKESIRKDTVSEDSEDVLVLFQQWSVSREWLDGIGASESDDSILKKLKVHPEAVSKAPLQTVRVAAEHFVYGTSAKCRSVERFETPSKRERQTPDSTQNNVRFGVVLDRWIFPESIVSVLNGSSRDVSVSLDAASIEGSVNVKQDRFQKQPSKQVMLNRKIQVEVAPPNAEWNSDLSVVGLLGSWHLLSVEAADDTTVTIDFLKLVPVE